MAGAGALLGGAWECAGMAHIELNHADMKPRAVVRYNIATEHGRAKQLLVAAFILTGVR
jgi:hypothetical protein